MNIFVKGNNLIKKVDSIEIIHDKKEQCFFIGDNKGEVLLFGLDFEICQKVIDNIGNRLERYIDHDYGDLYIDLDRLLEEVNVEE